MKPNWSINVRNSAGGSMAGPGWTRRRLKQGKSDYTSFRDPRVVFTRWDLSGYISDGAMLREECISDVGTVLL